MKHRTLLSLVLLMALLIYSFTGCAGPGERPTTDIPTTAPTTAPTAGPTRPSTTPTEPASEPTQPPTAATEPPDDGSFRFVATNCIQKNPPPEEYSIQVAVIDGQIYLDGVLYDHVSLVGKTKGYPVEFYRFMTRYAGTTAESAVAEVAQVVAEQGHYYLLETDSDCAFGKKVAIYQFDGGNYYFQQFGEDGWVSAVYAASISPEEPDEFGIIITSMTNFSDGSMTFIAPTYIQGNYSWAYTLNITVMNGQIYLEDCLYNEVAYMQELELIWPEIFGNAAAWWDAQNGNTDMTQVLEAIQNQSHCYLLLQSDEDTYGRVVLVYEIDPVLYFVTVSDTGYVMRVHYTRLPERAHDEFKGALSSAASAGEDGTELAAAVYLQRTPSWDYVLMVAHREGQVYLNEILYEKVTYVEHFELVLDEALLAVIAQREEESGSREMTELLEVIQNQPGCWLLESETDGALGSVAVYELDGTYYFIQFSETGEIANIYSADILWE